MIRALKAPAVMKAILSCLNASMGKEGAISEVTRRAKTDELYLLTDPNDPG